MISTILSFAKATHGCMILWTSLRTLPNFTIRPDVLVNMFGSLQILSKDRLAPKECLTG